MDRLNDHVLLHVFLMINNFYDILKFSMVNKYINDYFKYNRTYIFSTKFVTDALFVDSFYSYFLNFTSSINNRVNNLINGYNTKIQKMLSVIPVSKSCDKLKLAQLEFIHNIKYNINHKCVYQLLFCPSYILFRDIPAIEHWYLVIIRHNRLYPTLNTYFFDILKYHLINLNKSHPEHFKRLMKCQIEISHLDSEFYKRLFEILYRIDTELFRNMLCNFISTDGNNKDNINNRSAYDNYIDSAYDNYIDFTSDEIKYLRDKYSLNEFNRESTVVSSTFNKSFQLINC